MDEDNETGGARPRLHITGTVISGNALGGILVVGKDPNLHIEDSDISGNGGPGIQIQESSAPESAPAEPLEPPWYQRPVGAVAVMVIGTIIAAVAVALLGLGG